MRGVRLSDTFAKQARYQGTGACIYWDAAVHGYGLRVYPSGRRSWVVKFRVAAPGHKPRLEVLEDVAVMRESRARLKAQKALLAAGEGLDPFPPATALPHRYTLQELHDKYVELHVDPNNSPKTAYEVKLAWKSTLLPELGAATALVDILPAALLELKNRMAGRPYAFNRAVTYLHTALELAAKVYLWTPRSLDPDWQNPAAKQLVPRYREKKRQRLFRRHEAAAFAAVLDQVLECSEPMPGPAELAVGIIWLTGCRPGELLAGKREWVEWDPDSTALLKLPRAKGDRGDQQEGRIIGFGPRASELLRRLWKLGIAGNHHLVPSWGGSGRLMTFYGLWERLMVAAGIEAPYPTPYAMRHAWRTFGQGVIDRQAAMTQQGHKTEQMSEHYRDRLEDFQKAALVAMETQLLPPAKEVESSLH